jgi:hypothetical protein
MLLQLAERLEQGIEPTQPHNAAAYCVRSVGANASRDTDPVEVWRRYQPERAASNIVQPAY